MFLLVDLWHKLIPNTKSTIKIIFMIKYVPVIKIKEVKFYKIKQNVILIKVSKIEV